MNDGNLIIGPFIEFGFMRQALLGCIALALSAAPVGVFLMLRRMSLMGDAMAHAILPGAAIGYLIAGLSLTAMTLGGIFAGLTVAVGSGLVFYAVDDNAGHDQIGIVEHGPERMAERIPQFASFVDRARSLR